MTTRPTTVIRPITVVGQPPSLTLTQNPHQTINGRIGGTKVTPKARCHSCRMSQNTVDAEAEFHACVRCGLRQPTSRYSCCTSIKTLVLIDTNQEDNIFALTTTFIHHYIRHHTDRLLPQWPRNRSTYIKTETHGNHG